MTLLKTFHEEFVALTPGEGDFPKTFSMGDKDGPASQRPAREVTIGGPFSIARYEVPQDLWQAVMGENPSRWKGERNSVEMLSFEDAQTFCRKATLLMRAAKLIADDDVVRLPTEAEWEYAARAGTTTTFSFGDEAEKLDEFGWHTGNAAGNDPPVGAKKPNPWGLYDMHGYLWEWTLDPWHADYEGAPQNSAARDGGDAKRRVVRGGSWKDRADRCTCAFRMALPVDTRDDAVGLRCVLAQEK
ncbi:MAG: formylglycine-generating enzyme family protein [Planctomycetales bacterium]|nr:formylglycine-generating enzyme family protein [Planctomycetales bacterium]